jgi:hypothetical protein
VNRAIADTSVFIAREADRPLGDLPDEIAATKAGDCAGPRRRT